MSRSVWNRLSSTSLGSYLLLLIEDMTVTLDHMPLKVFFTAGPFPHTPRSATWTRFWVAAQRISQLNHTNF